MAATKNEGRSLPACENAAEKSRNYVRMHWKYAEAASSQPADCSDSACQTDSLSGLIDRLRSQALCISGMAFQDAWNMDLDRLQRCCVHIATPQKKLIPFCAYYLTDCSGRKFIDQDLSNSLR